MPISGDETRSFTNERQIFYGPCSLANLKDGGLFALNSRSALSPIDPDASFSIVGGCLAVEALVVGGVGEQRGHGVDLAGDAGVDLAPCTVQRGLERDGSVG